MVWMTNLQVQTVDNGSGSKSILPRAAFAGHSLPRVPASQALASSPSLRT